MSAGVMKCTTKERQAQAFSIYKTGGAIGFIIFSLFPPVFLKLLGYDGLFGVLTGVYILFFILSVVILPPLPHSEVKSELDSVSLWKCFTRRELLASYFGIFCGLFTVMGVGATLTMHLI